jgi:hypothetical protein
VVGMDEMTMRLSGTGLGDGEIGFTELAALAEAMQQLTLRIGRHLTGQEGPGRSPLAVERATALRLRGTARGSTVLDVAIGDEDVLGEGLEHRSLDALLEIFAGIAIDEAPTWVTPLLGEATVSVIDALSATSTRCEVATTRLLAPISFSPRTASRSIWNVTRAEPQRRPNVSVSGRLDLVDLRRARFRLRDAVGNDINLERVKAAEDAARLVGEVVTATGEAVLGSRGQIIGLTTASVVPDEWPDWTPPSLADIDFTFSAPPTTGIEGVDDNEVAAFLRMIRE